MASEQGVSGWRSSRSAVAAVSKTSPSHRARDPGGEVDLAPERVALPVDRTDLWTESVWRRPAVARWAVGEPLAYSGWGATLVHAGPLFIESYGMSPGPAGVLLGAAALGYFPGTLLSRRHVEHHARTVLVVLGLTAAAGTALLGLVRPSPAASVVVFAVAMAAIGGRSIAGSSFGLDAAPDQRVAVMSLRAAAIQFGYLFGAASGGAALAAGGYDSCSGSPSAPCFC